MLSDSRKKVLTGLSLVLGVVKGARAIPGHPGASPDSPMRPDAPRTDGRLTAV
jgi:hypothetical protein